MVKIEQTGGRLTEEEILHGKEDAYGIYQVNRKGAGRDYAFLSFDSLRSKGKVSIMYIWQPRFRRPTLPTAQEPSI